MRSGRVSEAFNEGLTDTGTTVAPVGSRNNCDNKGGEPPSASGTENGHACRLPVSADPETTISSTLLAHDPWRAMSGSGIRYFHCRTSLPLATFPQTESPTHWCQSICELVYSQHEFSIPALVKPVDTLLLLQEQTMRHAALTRPPESLGGTRDLTTSVLQTSAGKL